MARVVYPILATIGALLLFVYSRALESDVNYAERRVDELQAQIRNTPQQDRDIRHAYRVAEEWHQRYLLMEEEMALRERRCELEHEIRPLPVIALDAARAQELEMELPF